VGAFDSTLCYYCLMRRSILLPSLAVAALLALGTGLSSATAIDTVSQQIPGVLIGVGANQRSLLVGYTNSTIPGCGTIVGMEPSITETATSVTVTLTAEVSGEEFQYGCAGVGLIYTGAVPLPGPLAGRAINGLRLVGGAFQSGSGEMSSLVGLAPSDARLLLTSPGSPFVGLVDHRLHGRRSNRPPTVIAQRPAAGKPIRRGTIVVLTIG